MSQLKKILMTRDDMTSEEADAAIKYMRDAVLVDGQDPEEVLYEYGLEPDYVFDIL